MSERFHIVDLLAVHLRAPLEIPESRGVEPLLTHLADDLPTPMPYLLWERCRSTLHEQHPWLVGVQVPEEIDAYDWVYLWAWIDTLGRRHGQHHDVEPMEDPGVVVWEGEPDTETMRQLFGDED